MSSTGVLTSQSNNKWCAVGHVLGCDYVVVVLLSMTEVGCTQGCGLTQTSSHPFQRLAAIDSIAKTAPTSHDLCACLRRLQLATIPTQDKANINIGLLIACGPVVTCLGTCWLLPSRRICVEKSSTGRNKSKKASLLLIWLGIASN